MDALASDEVFLFEGFRLDRRAGGLFRADENGALIPVAIGSRALDLLILLVTRHRDLVSRDEIMSIVWRGMIVEDSNLPAQILALRRVIDRDRARGSCIQTVSGRGYRFVAAVSRPSVQDRSGAAVISDPAPPPGGAQRPTAPTRIMSGDGDRSGPWRRRLMFIPSPAVIGDRRRSDQTCTPHLSLVVLPFASFSDSPDQQHLSDRITEDLTTDLSRFNNMRVVSRTTALAYRNKPIDARQIGRELGVRHLLEGSVQRFSDRVRVNVHLIDTHGDAHLWAERFDRNSAEWIGIDEITKQTEVAIYRELIVAEASRITDHPDALDYVLRARAAQFKPSDRENYAEAIGLLERALALDPHSAEARGWLADKLVGRALDEMTDTPAADISRAAGLAAQAMTGSPRSAFAHSAQGQVLRAQGRCKEAIAEYETASAINPGWPHPYGFLSNCKLWTGSIADTIPLAEQAIQISPRDPRVADWYSQIGRVHLLLSRTNDAIVWLDRARSVNPQFPVVHAMLASAYALNGEIERAAAELAEARRLSVGGRYYSLARLRAAHRDYWGVPKIRALFEATHFAGLRKAAMPDD